RANSSIRRCCGFRLARSSCAIRLRESRRLFFCRTAAISSAVSRGRGWGDFCRAASLCSSTDLLSQPRATIRLYPVRYTLRTGLVWSVHGTVGAEISAEIESNTAACSYFVTGNNFALCASQLRNYYLCKVFDRCLLGPSRSPEIARLGL